MAGESVEEGVFCNYCGEKVDLFNDAYQHVSRDHGEEIHTGLEPFDPARKKKALVIGFGGTISTMVVFVAFMAMWADRLDGEVVIGLVLAYCALLVAFLVVPDFYYGRKYEKSWDEIIDDLVKYCPVCGAKLRFGDCNSHTETYHPEERAIERRVYLPVFLVVITLFVLGFAGLIAAGILGEEGILSTRGAIALFAISGLSLVMGAAISYLFEKRYHEPHMKKLAEERLRRHPEQER